MGVPPTSTAVLGPSAIQNVFIVKGLLMVLPPDWTKPQSSGTTPHDSKIRLALGGTEMAAPISSVRDDCSYSSTRWPARRRDTAAARPAMPAPAITTCNSITRCTAQQRNETEYGGCVKDTTQRDMGLNFMNIFIFLLVNESQRTPLREMRSTGYACRSVGGGTQACRS